MKLRWSHCVLYVRDMPTMVDFYEGVLGFRVADRGPLDRSNPGGPQIVFLSQADSDHHQIAFADVRGDGPSTTLDHIAFRVDSLDDVKGMAKRLRADGRATELAPVSHGNAWSIYFRDPEGNRIEVFCDSPFHVAQPQIESWDLSTSEADLLSSTRKKFADEPGFGPMDEYRSQQRRKLGS